MASLMHPQHAAIRPVVTCAVQVRTDMYYEYHGHSKPKHAESSLESPTADGSISAAQSAQDILNIVSDLSLENTGRFWNHDGSELPW